MGDSMRDVISAPAPGLDLGREYGHHQSPAIRAGGLIFCSGMVAINPESGEREHTFHFTPTLCPSANAVEGLFAKLTRNASSAASSPRSSHCRPRSTAY